MALEKTFRQLSVNLHKLDDELKMLQVTVGDAPPKNPTVLTDILEDKLLEMMGMLHEMGEAAIQAQKAVTPPVDLERALHALTACQERFHKIEQRFVSNLISYDTLSDITKLGNERRREWLGWAEGIRDGIERCRQPFYEASVALAACWKEIAEIAIVGSQLNERRQRKRVRSGRLTQRRTSASS